MQGPSQVRVLYGRRTRQEHPRISRRNIRLGTATRPSLFRQDRTNRAQQEQAGGGAPHNIATISQDGSDNIAVQKQSGFENQGTIHQDVASIGNSAYQEQAGNGNRADITQAGSNGGANSYGTFDYAAYQYQNGTGLTASTKTQCQYVVSEPRYGNYTCNRLSRSVTICFLRSLPESLMPVHLLHSLPRFLFPALHRRVFGSRHLRQPLDKGSDRP
jgi:hypothetical protein